MRTYVMFLVTGALTLLGFGATMVLKGGWDSVLAALVVLGGAACLTSFIALLAAGERPAPRHS